MALIVSIAGVVFAVICVWLTVRIVNRRERWAKWTAVGLIALVMYPASIGPAIWLASRQSWARPPVRLIYWPVGWACSSAESQILMQRLRQYAVWGAPSKVMVEIPLGPNLITFTTKR